MKGAIRATLVAVALLVLSSWNLIAGVPATRQPELRETTDCTRGDVSINCKIHTQDGSAPGVWHDIDLHVGNSGGISMIVDGSRYRLMGKYSRFHEGYNIDTYSLLRPGGDAQATVTVKRGNDGDSVNVSISKVDRHAVDDLLNGLSKARNSH